MAIWAASLKLGQREPESHLCQKRKATPSIFLAEEKFSRPQTLSLQATTAASWQKREPELPDPNESFGIFAPTTISSPAHHTSPGPHLISLSIPIKKEPELQSMAPPLTKAAGL